MITLIWTDGSITTGKSYRDLETAMRAEQWRTYRSRWHFRTAMRQRAATWSGQQPRMGYTHRSFIESLAEAGLFMITTNEVGDNQ